jgi:hypothetical protein
MTINEAKKIIKTELENRMVPYYKVTARTVNFSDLARHSTIFVQISISGGECINAKI